MRKKYIVAVEGLSKEDEGKFVEFLRTNGILWWHWLKDFWLIVDTSEEDRRIAIRDFLSDLDTSKMGVVFEFSGEDAWSAFGPEQTSDRMFKWLHSIWK